MRVGWNGVATFPMTAWLVGQLAHTTLREIPFFLRGCNFAICISVCFGLCVMAKGGELDDFRSSLLAVFCEEGYCIRLASLLGIFGLPEPGWKNKVWGGSSMG